MKFVLRLPIRQAVNLLRKGVDERDNEKIYQLYILDRQKMTESTFMSFPDYCKAIKGERHQSDNRPKDELMEELGFIPRKE